MALIKRMLTNVSEYEEEVVHVLGKTFDRRDIDRIKQGLDSVARELKATEPALRDKNALKSSSQLALFEALSNKAFLADDALLAEHFQEPFTLVQTNKRLRILRYVPASTNFLFDKDHDRSSWATLTWSKYQVEPTMEEFDFAIREPLLMNMQRVFESVIDPATIQRTWHAIGLIVNKLTNDLVTHSLLAMEINVFMLALDHLKYEVPGFRNLVGSIQKLLELAPKDFWDSMGAISPTTYIEQIFNNKQYDTFMMEAKEKDVNESSALRDMLSWIKPFMASLQTVHQARACRSLTSQLLKRLQGQRFPIHSRVECYRIGLATLTWTLSNCSKEDAMLSQVGKVVAVETLDVVSENIKDILMIPSLPSSDQFYEHCGEFCLRIVKVSLALECKALRTDQEALKQRKDLPAGHPSHAHAIWDAVVLSMDGNIAIAKAALIGINDLTGLEKFKLNADDKHREDKKGYNHKLGRLTHLVGQIFERINDFNPSDLDKLFRHTDTATALVASLFTSDTNLYEAGVNLIKSISSESARREAIGHLLKTFFDTTLNAFSWSIRRIARSKTYASCPRMLKTSADALDVLCDSQNGLLRTKSLSGFIEIKALENFWEHQWEGLRVIYETTEEWGRAKMDDSETLKEFCRDTMQFSERFFDQYSVFASAIDSAVKVKSEEPNKVESEKAGKELLKHPAMILEAVVKWLRLKDLFLVEISVALAKKILDRLTEWGMTVTEAPSDFLEQVINNGPRGRTLLTPQQKAELARALEANLGRSVAVRPMEVDSETPSDMSRERSAGNKKKKKKASVIDMEQWASKSKPVSQVIEVSDDDEFNDAALADEDMLSAGRLAYATEKTREQPATLASAKRTLPFQSRGPVATSKQEKSASKVTKGPIQSDADRILFREKREKEREAKKKRDAEAIAMVKKRPVGIAGQTLGEGSGLNGIGVKGKDHAPKGPNIMVSSGSEPDSDDSLDEALFGGALKHPKVSNAVREYQANKIAQASKGPIKKTRVVRSAKDMRARLAPDLTALHKTILGWDFFHRGDFPPGSARDDYSLVTSEFKTPLDYQSVFEPLLVLEAWQGFLKSREEGNFRAFEVKVANRMTVDSFLEVSTTMPMAEGKELGIGEADIVLLSKGQSPANDAQQPHCFARVYKITRKKGTIEITYRANVGNALVTAMVPNTVIYGTKVASNTPLEREYGALLGLKYFDLCDEVTKGRPSPLLTYSDKQLSPLLSNYGINMAQAKAVRSAMDNDAFTLIQGPPGSGKTKTIVAIVGALLGSSFVDNGISIARPPSTTQAPRATSGKALKKLLVCAPSNAAVDELVMRFKQGVKTMNGEHQKVSVVRIGRSDAINANVLDVTLEELVNAKLNIASGKKAGSGEDIAKIMTAHKATCEEFNTLRNTVDELKAKGKPVTPEQNRNFELLKRRKQQLSNQIDAARDSGDTAARDAEISRRRVQQEVVDGAHVICATLSGSGHEMFQGLNVEFETVVIDEAAQSIELSALIPLKYGCSKCILVGDPKQLPPTVLSREAARFQYEQSLFVRMQANHPSDVHLLDTQYRMHPEISLFPSRSFYDGRLLDGPGMAKRRTKPWHQSNILGPYRFFDVQGTHQSAPRGHSLINLAEIEVALTLYNRLTTDCNDYDFKGKIGIITPYKSQLRELRSRFAQKYGEIILTNVEFNTTDAFQGRESEVIIFSCVRASLHKGIGFLSDIRRMNVGITRAKASLWVLGNSQSLIQGEFWGQLVRDAKSRDRYTDGDLISLLRKPLVDGKSQTAPVNNDGDIEMTDAPVLAGSTTTSARSSAVVTPVDKGMFEYSNAAPYQPSGGANGLNVNNTCQVCGSSQHHTNRCDNKEALEQAKGRCFRCRDVGHVKKFCTVDRCLICGEIGHDQKLCTSTNPLSRKERERIGKLEIEHRLLLAERPEEMRKKQLGDHDRRVPVVRSTSSTPPAERESKKRKRESLSIDPARVPKGPKAPNGTPRGPRTPSSHGSQPPLKQTNSKMVERQNGMNLQSSLHQSMYATSNSSASPNPLANPHAQYLLGSPDLPRSDFQGVPGTRDPGLPHRPPANIVQVGEGQQGPSAPKPPQPQRNVVRPPKRKKDVDPFIRPKPKR